MASSDNNKISAPPDYQGSCTYEPIAYQRGYQDFYGRNFQVTKAVLIPRPETEQLIDEVLKLAGKPFLPGVKPTKRELPERPRIIDIGTGSGNLAITTKLELPDAQVIALDISEPALAVARSNAKNLNSDVQFLKSDLLKNYHDQAPDLIIANLPYVDQTWDWLDQAALAAEPALALYADDHGLALIKTLLEQIKDRDWHTHILLEADPCQRAALLAFAHALGFFSPDSDTPSNAPPASGFIIHLVSCYN